MEAFGKQVIALDAGGSIVTSISRDADPLPLSKLLCGGGGGGGDGGGIGGGESGASAGENSSNKEWQE